MTLRKWLKVIDPICDIVIWADYDNEEPIFEGSVFDIPWVWVDCEIGRGENDDSEDEPIYISKHINKYGVEMPLIVANIIDR